MTVVDTFTTWASGRPGIEPDVVQTLAEFKRDYCSRADPARWECGDLGVLLLDVIPRKVVADDEWFDAVLPTVREYLQFLADRRLLHRRGESLPHLLEELDDIEREFWSVVHDPRVQGPGKAILTAMMPAGAGMPTDQAGLDDLMNRFNALPLAERDRILGHAVPLPLRAAGIGGLDDEALGVEFDDDEEEGSAPLAGMSMPAVRRYPGDQLAAAARQSTTLNQLAGLADWLGAGRPLTSTGVLKVADARRVIGHLGLAEGGTEGSEPEPEAVGGAESVGGAAPGPEASRGDDPLPALRSARDFLPLNRLWTIAEELEWIEVSRSRAMPGPAALRWQADEDPDVVQLWSDVFDLVVEAGPALGRTGGWYLPWLEELVPAVLVDLLGHAYVGTAVDPAALVADCVSQQDLPDPKLAADLLPTLLDAELERMIALGALCRDGDRVLATPLGISGFHRQLTSLGADAPAVDPLELSAAEVLQAPELYHPESSGLLAEWVRARGEEAAAREVLAAASALDSSTARLSAMHLLSEAIGPAARSVVPEYLDDPRLGPHLRLSPDFGDPSALNRLSEQERLFLLVDGLAPLAALVEPPVRTEDLPPEAWEMAEALLTQAEVWRHPHPELCAVLDAIGTGHPVGRIRKAAKKAAHKARISRAG